ncbi:MAG: AraC family transcriptional regulator [Sediminibacterium sp.]|nr:AraC family transcriptional regulator [Sediminibacterium sp.]
MKPKIEQLLQKNEHLSFLCYEVNVPSFDFFWHYHPEYELTYIQNGYGKRLVGDSYENFKAGDLVLLGPHLPHTWITEKGKKETCRAIVIQFTRAFVEQLFLFPEMNSFEKLFAKTDRGLQFKTAENDDCVLLLQQMIKRNNISRFSLLLQLLELLMNKKSTSIASAKYKLLKGNEDQLRINKVFQYVQKEFKEGVSLNQAAGIIHLSESAFCKFFKKASGKTFSDYTNEIRIAYSCQLLLETDKPINEIAYECGFESLTYFNRIFLRKKKMKPRIYRKMQG